MDRTTLLLLALAGAAAYYVYTDQQSLVSDAEDAGDTIMADVIGWQNVNEGPTWIPYLNATEASLGLPANLLARMAFQESSFRQGVIDGTTPSSAGALGIMQMMPAYFTSVQVPVPFSSADTQAQIQQAGAQMVSLYASTGSWELALAAYNAGLGNVQKYGGIPPFTETQNYVADIVADVPSIQSA